MSLAPWRCPHASRPDDARMPLRLGDARMPLAPWRCPHASRALAIIHKPTQKEANHHPTVYTLHNFTISSLPVLYFVLIFSSHLTLCHAPTHHSPSSLSLSLSALPPILSIS
ncbi:hypothetical protein VNO80_21869 [Phaseolus coccineus]|uniref:Uncharacterized protein n=1 Tax=Phaseolus coccineus TaxID=3886 RepID=A0AAN9M418_PHACN